MWKKYFQVTRIKTIFAKKYIVMARLDEYDYQLCVEVCEKVSLGENIKKVLESDPDRYPTFPTFCKWKRENPELFNLYINCHQDKAVAMEQEMDLYKEMLLRKEIDPSTYNVLVQTLKWKMAKFYPKVFGDKLDVTSKDEKIESKDPLELLKEYVAINKQANSGS